MTIDDIEGFSSAVDNMTDGNRMQKAGGINWIEIPPTLLTGLKRMLLCR